MGGLPARELKKLSVFYFLKTMTYCLQKLKNVWVYFNKSGVHLFLYEILKTALGDALS